MSTAAAVQSAPASVPSKIQVGQVLVVGKLMKIQKAGQMYEHLVIQPAPDEYSSPATLSILSKLRLGQVDDQVRVLCRLSGFRRTYKMTDRETGEVMTRTTADNKLFAVDE